MNTKQLWFALSHNCHTNPYFDGIYSIDTLKDIKEILNLLFVTQIHQVILKNIGFSSFLIPNNL